MQLKIKNVLFFFFLKKAILVAKNCKKGICWIFKQIWANIKVQFQSDQYEKWVDDIVDKIIK